MQLQEKAKEIQRILDLLYPEVAIPLEHKDAYTLLIAVLLSAQCTDRRVNQVTPRLFAKADHPAAMIQLPIEEIREIIHPCGLAATKAKAIWNLSSILVERHQSQVPRTFDELEALPGVGHKTASVVMLQAFGIPAFPVDTHIHRLAHRWGLSDGLHVKKTEADLKALYPPEAWGLLHLQIITFGRNVCPARGHAPASCPICSWAGVQVGATDSGARDS